MALEANATFTHQWPQCFRLHASLWSIDSRSRSGAGAGNATSALDFAQTAYDTATLFDVHLDPKVLPNKQLIDALTIDESGVGGDAHLYRIDVSSFPGGTLSVAGNVDTGGTRQGTFTLHACDPGSQLDQAVDVAPDTSFYLSTVLGAGTSAVWLIVTGHHGSSSESPNTATFTVGVDRLIPQ